MAKKLKRRGRKGLGNFFEAFLRVLVEQPGLGKLDQLEGAAMGLFEGKYYSNKNLAKRLHLKLSEHPEAQAKFAKLKKRAEKGSTVAMRDLGNSYAFGLQGRPDGRLGLLWWKRAFAKGDAAAARWIAEYLGSHSEFRHETEADYSDSKAWMITAARMGDKWAIPIAAHDLLEPGIPLDRYKLAVKLLKKAKADGDSYSALFLKNVTNWQFFDGTTRYRVLKNKGLNPVLVGMDSTKRFFD